MTRADRNLVNSNFATCRPCVKKTDDGTTPTLEERQDEAEAEAETEAAQEAEEAAEAATAASEQGGAAAAEDLSKCHTYRVPRGARVGGVGTAYVVDRTPEEIAQDLLSSKNEEDEGGDGGNGSETGSATDEENELREEEREARRDEGQSGDAAEAAAAIAGAGAGGDGKKGKSKEGGKGKGGKGAAATPGAADVAAAAMADLPRYWRGKFVPLTDDELQALEREKGREGLEEYLDKR